MAAEGVAPTDCALAGIIADNEIISEKASVYIVFIKSDFGG